MRDPIPNSPLRPPPSALAIPPDAVCFNRLVNTLLLEVLLVPALDGFPNARAVPIGLALSESALVAPLRLEIFGKAEAVALSGRVILLESLLLLPGSKGFLDVAIFSFRSPLLL